MTIMKKNSTSIIICIICITFASLIQLSILFYLLTHIELLIGRPFLYEEIIRIMIASKGYVFLLLFFLELGIIVFGTKSNIVSRIVSLLIYITIELILIVYCLYLWIIRTTGRGLWGIGYLSIIIGLIIMLIFPKVVIMVVSWHQVGAQRLLI